METRQEDMERIKAKAKVTNSVDAFAVQTGQMSASNARSIEVEFLVDTGAAMLCLPVV